MPSLRTLALVALSLAGPVLAVPERTTVQKVVDHQGFSELLNALPEESIHAALHSHLDPQYKDGVYEYDRQAVEQIHDTDPPMATKLISAAIIELAKRQASANTTADATTSSADTTVETTTPVSTTDGSTTTPSDVVATSSNTPTSASSSTAPPPSSQETSAAPPPSSTTPTVVVPVTVETTNSEGSTTQITTSAIAEASDSVTVEVTTTNDAGDTVTSSQVVPATVGETTDAQGSTVRTTAAASIYTPPPAPSTDAQGRADVTTTDSFGETVVLSGVTSGQVVSTTDARGHTFVTTYTPGGGAVSSLVLQTVTGANGQQSTITSLAVVTPGSTPTGEAGASGSATSSSRPGLQNGAERPRGMGAELVVLVVGAVGMGMLI